MAGQAKIKNKKAFYKKDEALFIAPYQESPNFESIENANWQDIGPVTDSTAEDATETETPEAKNYLHSQSITGESENLSITVQQLIPSYLNILSGDTQRIKEIPGTLQTGINIDYNPGQLDSSKILPLPYQNHDFTPVTINSIFQDYNLAEPVNLVLNTDYSIVFDSNNKTSIVFLPNGSFNNTKNLRINIDYTPAGKTRLLKGGSDEIIPFMLKSYTRQADGRKLIIYRPRVDFTGGGAVQFQDKKSSNFINVPFQFTAKEHDNFFDDDGKKILRWISFE